MCFGLVLVSFPKEAVGLLVLEVGFRGLLPGRALRWVCTDSDECWKALKREKKGRFYYTIN